jgi:hypothetical protein
LIVLFERNKETLGDHMRSINRIWAVVFGVGIMALAAINVARVANAGCGACQIYWDEPEPECAEINNTSPDRLFDYNDTTKAASAGKTPTWTVYQAIATGPGSNIENVSVSPATFDVPVVSGIGYAEQLTRCQGKLKSGFSSGFSDLSSYDGSGCLDCSGVHRTNIVLPNDC